MEKEFIPYSEALALKELGFDEPCVQAYHTNGENELSAFYSNPNIVDEWLKKLPLIKAPLYQQAFRWFKEKYKLMLCITPCSDGEYIFTLYDLNKCDLEVFVEDIEIMESEDSYEFFEDAELEGLKKLIEIVKNK